MSAQSALEKVEAIQETQRTTLDQLMTLLSNCGLAHSRSDEKSRRDYNHAWFSRLELDVDDEGLTAVQRTDVLGALTDLREQGL